MKQTVKNFLETHKKRISPLLFLGGFVFDLFTLTQVDLLYDNMVLLGHLLIITFSIYLIHLGKRHQVFPNILEKMIMFAPFTLVFSFGGILSGYVIFYTKSASLVSNWPFLLVLYALFLTSELVFNKFQQTLFQVGMWFAATLSFCIFFVPVMVRAVNPWVFLISNVISIFIGWLFIHLLIKAYNPTKEYLPFIKTMFISISFGFIALYFLNVIPPIPLSMKESGMYHNIYRNDANELVGERPENTLWQRIFPIDNVTIKQGTTLYAYTSIYSPAGIDTYVNHIWEYKDTNGVWNEFNNVSFSLTGGRNDGFRWYSFAKPFAGDWRVRTTTRHGQEIGVIFFSVSNTTLEPILISEVL